MLPAAPQGGRLCLTPGAMVSGLPMLAPAVPPQGCEYGGKARQDSAPPQLSISRVKPSKA